MNYKPVKSMTNYEIDNERDLIRAFCADELSRARCPKCNSPMVLKFTKSNPLDGFFSCRDFPNCRGSRGLPTHNTKDDSAASRLQYAVDQFLDDWSETNLAEIIKRCEAYREVKSAPYNDDDLYDLLGV